MNIEASSPGRLRQQEAKRDQIVAAATDLFLQHGLSAVSMDAVVEAAGVSKRTLYKYFASKDGLFLAALEAQMNELMPGLEEHRAAGRNLEDALQAAGEAILRTAIKPVPIALYRIVLSEAVRFPSLAQAYQEAGPARLEHALADIIRKAKLPDGAPPPEPEQLAESFIDLTLSRFHSRIVLGLEPPLDAAAIKVHVRKAVRLVLSAYYIV